MCCDYRKLNGKTVADSQPIPRIQDLLDGLSGKKWFSTLDMSKAYHQGYIHEDSRHLTAFATPWTLYEWVRIPFGLRNAPPAFQRFMNSVLGDLKGTVCDPYIDDVLCYAEDFDGGLVGLKKVLQRLRSKGVKLRADKCVIMKQEVKYLGRLISGDGYRMDPKETEALERFREPPKNIGEVRSLLGIFGYYRCYIRDFAKKVKPLYELLNGDKHEEVKENGRKLGKRVGQKYNSKEPVTWNAELQRIVDDLIKHLKSEEVIAYPDFDETFFLTCDASNFGLGAVLYQNQKGVDRVIGYASRTLTEAERNYNLHSGKLEFLALKWAVTERFGDYLKYSPRKFLVYTDNNPLTYVLTSAKLNATGLRWVADLAEYDFSIKYRPGRENVDADCLSRKPLELSDLQKMCTESVEPSSVAAVMVNAKNMKNDDGVVLQCRIEASVCELHDSSEDVLQVSKEELIEEQKKDPVVGPVRQCVINQSKPKRAGWDEMCWDSKILMKSFGKLKMVDGLLVRQTAKAQQVVLPSKFHHIVYVELHEKMAHVGVEKVLDLAQQRFYWPRMSKDIEHYIQRKCRCIVTKQPNQADRAPLVPIKATRPFQMIELDFLEIDKDKQCKGGFRYALVLVDHFTRFCQMYATRAKSSQAAAAKMWNEFIPRFGFPERIHHDQGPEFNSLLWKELHRYSGVTASNTTPYHPMGDGMVERLNQTALNMLKAIPEREKKRWKDHLPKLAFAYNSTVNKTTGYSPFFLMFGRNSSLPIDRMFGLDSTTTTNIKRKSHSQFVKEWKGKMEEAFRLANENIEKAANYNKQNYDKKVRGTELKVGDQVLVRNMREKTGARKLRSHWERCVFEVVAKKPDLPVYIIQNVNKEKDRRTVHRNMLMECNDLPRTVFEEGQEVKKVKETVGKNVNNNNNKKKISVRKKKKDEEKQQIVVVDDDQSTEEEMDDVVVSWHEDVAASARGAEVEDGAVETEASADGTPDESETEEMERDVESDDPGEETNETENESGDASVTESDSDEEDMLPVRRSTRQSKPPLKFSYDVVGGPPVLVDVNS